MDGIIPEVAAGAILRKSDSCVELSDGEFHRIFGNEGEHVREI